MDWFDTPGEISALLAAIATIFAGLLWLIKSQIGIQKEFKPNSGSTTRDSLDRIERKLDNVERKIDDHINWHLGD